MTTSPKSRTTTLILAIALGAFGVHRFYVGKVGSGVAQLLLTLTVIGLLISGWWVFVDWIVIASGTFRDGDGLKITDWHPKKKDDLSAEF